MNQINLELKQFISSLDEINFNYLFGNNAIVAQLLKTELFNNNNIDLKFIFGFLPCPR